MSAEPRGSTANKSWEFECIQESDLGFAAFTGTSTADVNVDALSEISR
jgi:hypothetical protein